MKRRLQSQPKPQNQKTPSTQATELTFLEHIYELRSRLFWVVLVLVVTSAFGFQIKDQLIAVVMAPLHGEKLVYLTPGGGFSFIFTLSIYFGVLLTIPFAIYHLYRFLQPLLKNSSRRLIITFIFLSSLLAVAGAAFGYFVTIPAALNFLSTFAGDTVTPNLTADSYLNFVAAYIVGLALLFQLPLLLFLFDHIRPFPPGALLGTQRFVIIAATIAAAIITPTPDAVNMAIVAVPIIGVYQLGAVAVYTRRRATRKQTRRREIATTRARENDIPAEIVASVITKEEPPVLKPEKAPAQQQVLQVTSMAPRQAQPVKRRSIDGFTVATRRASTVQVPPRQTVVTPPTRQLRSIDGLSIV